MRQPKSKIQKTVMIMILVIVLFFAASLILDKIIYDQQFQRAEAPDLAIQAGYFYDDFADTYEMFPVSFQSGKNTLAGYVFEPENSLGLIVLAHGLGGGADAYFKLTKYFLDQDWSVFAYDCTGSYNSEGKTTRGFPQAILDLDAALTFVDKDPLLSEKKIVLFGHSWGGYAAANILNKDHPVSAVVSVSGVNQATEFINNQTIDMLGVFAYTQFPTMNLYQTILFGKTAWYTAVEGINRTDIPVMIVHGENDDVTRYERDSILSHQDEITNPNAVFVTISGKQGGHNSIFRSIESIEYLETINAEYREIYDSHDGAIPYDINVDFYAKLDDALVADLNEDLMTQVQAFLLDAVE
jgi:pimeloyl-ACP methyl ester carboxylesterase